MEKLRLFFAVTISKRLRETIGHFQDQCRAADVDVKWVEIDNIHSTLKFLGDTPADKLAELFGAAEFIAQSISPFDMFLDGFGAFPDLRKPRILWTGITRGKERLAHLHLSLDERLESLGFARESRSFSPHLTIGRVRSPRGAGNLARIMEKIKNAKVGETSVSSFSLMKSTLMPQGPIYAELGNFQLGAAHG
jgi:RNA 2',3'-cyclic 3'-phosphodiesterase